ncbi:MAG: T9SS type A sorting domain-containing protein, partial [Chitinophagaceae bacterium]
RDGRSTLSSVVRLTYQQGNRQPSLVYPNPTKGVITVAIGDRTLLNTNASLFDQNGKLLQSVKITANTQSFDLSRYTNGTYYIRLNNGEVMKVIKQ